MNITKEMEDYERVLNGNEAAFDAIREKIEFAFNDLELYSKDHNYPGQFKISYDTELKGNTLKLEIHIPSGE